MKKCFFLFMALPILGFSQTMEGLRANYPKATEDEALAQALYAELAHVSADGDAVLLAYKGAVLTLLGKFAKVVKAKKGYFKKGAGLIEQAVDAQPNAIEIRCLRLGVQENAPKIAGYGTSINDDKKFILDNYGMTKDEGAKKFVKGFVTVSKMFTQAEKELF